MWWCIIRVLWKLDSFSVTATTLRRRNICFKKDTLHQCTFFGGRQFLFFNRLKHILWGDIIFVDPQTPPAPPPSPPPTHTRPAGRKGRKTRGLCNIVSVNIRKVDGPIIARTQQARFAFQTYSLTHSNHLNNSFLYNCDQGVYFIYFQGYVNTEREREWKYIVNIRISNL